MLPSGEDEVLTREAVEVALRTSGLSHGELVVITRRFGLDSEARERTLDEVAADVGVTRERVRQIEGKALKKLQKSKAARSAIE